MLKDLIQTYGKRKLNSLTKYPSILTLHKLGEKGRLLPELTSPDIFSHDLFATEKIDGTNVRILCMGDEFIYGSREFLLAHKDDLFFDPSQGIVDAMKSIIKRNLPTPRSLTVFYGELYGGKVSSNSKQYGTDKVGFRLFDACVIPDLSILELDLESISSWREYESDNGLVYGQSFMHYEELSEYLQFEMVPPVRVTFRGTTHSEVLDTLKGVLPATKAALSDTALLKPEGIILRNEDRSRIVKVRYEDYERTLRK